MKMVVYIWRRMDSYPGHMVVGYENQEKRIIGYRFNPKDLPKEFQEMNRWRDYLFNHHVPGYIVDETARIETLKLKIKNYLKRSWVMVDESKKNVIPINIGETIEFARYSFQPDKFNSKNNPCYNCVTYAIMIANKMIRNTFDEKKFKSGRVKLIVQELEKHEKSAPNN